MKKMLQADIYEVLTKIGKSQENLNKISKMAFIEMLGMLQRFQNCIYFSLDGWCLLFSFKFMGKIKCGLSKKIKARIN